MTCGQVSGFLLLPCYYTSLHEILGCSCGNFRVVAQQPYCSVALATQDPAHVPFGVAMVDTSRGWFLVIRILPDQGDFTNCALTTLGLEHVHNLGVRNTISTLYLRDPSTLTALPRQPIFTIGPPVERVGG